MDTAITEKRRNLLIVDDEIGPRESLRIVFKDEYDVYTAESGIEALEMLERQDIDAAILDIKMVPMNGIQLLQRIKEHDETVEVIMLTAYETVETARQALRLGACDYHTKPFEISGLRSAVNKAMERHSLNNEVNKNAEKLADLQAKLHNQKLQEEIARSKGEIYASIIHDINGPLTIISGFMEILNQRLGDTDQLSGKELNFVKDRLARITRQVSNCIDISQRYLGFLRRRSGEEDEVGVNQIMDDVAGLLKSHPSQQGNTLTVKPLKKDIRTKVNGTDLIQVLKNLAANGLQCTEKPHDVEISAELLTEPLDTAPFVDDPNNRYINLEAFDNQAPLVAVSVRDNGPGIPKDILGKIFDTYFTTKEKGAGTGLGLSIVVRLIKECKGALHLCTRSGEGSTFKLYLPAKT